MKIQKPIRGALVHNKFSYLSGQGALPVPWKTEKKIFMNRNYSPCLCHQPHRKAHHPGRGFPHHRAPTGEPAASSWHPAEQGGNKIKINSGFKNDPKHEKVWQQL